jgi:hypothetical protein
MLRKVNSTGTYARYFNNFNRCLSTINKCEPQQPPQEPRKPKPLRDRKTFQYFNHPDRSDALRYPEILFKRRTIKKLEQFYVADNSGATIINEELKKNLPDDKPLMEVNCGVGLLTKKLLNETKNDLYLYESEKDLLENLTVSRIITRPMSNR